MNPDTTTGFTRIKLEGSRHCDVALLFLSIATVFAMVMNAQPVLVAAGCVALVLTGWALRGQRRLRALCCEDGSALTCVLRDGTVRSGRPVTVRFGRLWLSVTLRPDTGRDVSLMLFGDQFADADDFRRLRRWLRARLRDDAPPGAAAGWSGWRSRWFAGNRD
jgi:hypothetical protein